MGIKPATGKGEHSWRPWVTVGEDAWGYLWVNRLWVMSERPSALILSQSPRRWGRRWEPMGCCRAGGI